MAKLSGIAIPVFLALAVTASRSHAEPAVDLLKEALEKRRQGVESKSPAKLEEALELFKRAHEMERSGRTMGLLAICEQLLGRWEESEEHMVQALADYPADRWIADHRGELEKALEANRGRFGHLVITGTPAGAEVWVNRKMRGMLPLEGALRVPEGPAHLQVTARGGFRPFIANPPVIVRAGQQTAVAVNLERVRYVELTPPSAERSAAGGPPAGTPQDLSRSRAGWNTRQIAGLVIGGVGVAAMVAGAVLIQQARAWCGDIRANRRGCNDPGAEERPGWLLLGTGGATAAVGTGFWIFGRRIEASAGTSSVAASVGGTF